MGYKRKRYVQFDDRERKRVEHLITFGRRYLAERLVVVERSLRRVLADRQKESTS